jgi:hypothetical protein
VQPLRLGGAVQMWLGAFGQGDDIGGRCASTARVSPRVEVASVHARNVSSCTIRRSLPAPSYAGSCAPTPGRQADQEQIAPPPPSHSHGKDPNKRRGCSSAKRCVVTAMGALVRALVGRRIMALLQQVKAPVAALGEQRLAPTPSLCAAINSIANAAVQPSTNPRCPLGQPPKKFIADRHARPTKCRPTQDSTGAR